MSDGGETGRSKKTSDKDNIKNLMLNVLPFVMRCREGCNATVLFLVPQWENKLQMQTTEWTLHLYRRLTRSHSHDSTAFRWSLVKFILILMYIYTCNSSLSLCFHSHHVAVLNWFHSCNNFCSFLHFTHTHLTRCQRYKQEQSNYVHIN